MKPGLVRLAGSALAVARRYVWMSTWLLWAPMGVYITWLNRGHTLVGLQVALLVVSVIALGVINSETVVVFLRHYRPRWFRDCERGWIQHWLQQLPFCRRSARSRALDRVEPCLLPSGMGVAPDRLPFVSVVVAAYLPNEQEIIEATLYHWLTG